MAKTVPAMIKVVVAAAGTPQQVSTTTQRFLSAIFQAASANTGLCYIGIKSDPTAPRLEISPGDAVTLSVGFSRDLKQWFDFIDIYVDADTDSNRVNIAYETSNL